MTHPPPPVAAQLWSLHEQAAEDLLGVLERVAEIGFAAVEPISLYGNAPSAVRDALDRLGLDVCSMHVPFPSGQDAPAVLDACAELGVTTLVWSLEPEEFGTLDGIRAGAERINRAAANAAGRGMRIGYHNHFAEFVNVHGGRRAYDILLGELDPAVVVELDTYWVATAGLDPARVAAGLGDRLEFTHLKDGPATGMEDCMVPFGEGTVDVAAAARANPAVRWHIVEADRSRQDMYALLRSCYDFLVGAGLATGNRPVPAGGPASGGRRGGVA
ncbi:sugar phosphate isomerase/epimerase [Nonomuraea sp. B12E4]|uniref:sugar phosphate isomerase/epimerase family protein n=1 Tax=Nonomuraea sp. B12E4 TaxID=3153564 RepID=UPI00325D3EFD